ncbi:retrovirus-related pol polyprotein from transposon TNT 1-94 [Tanacetum coccineum]
MLAPGHYVQWKSRLKRYIDTKPNKELIHHCLTNPPYKHKWIPSTTTVAEYGTETITPGHMEAYHNVPKEIKEQLDAEAETVQIILTRIDNDIYSIVDAYPNACEMWKAIKRLKHGESINVKDLETNLYWEFGKFTSQDGEPLESYYSRFYKMMNELVRNKCEISNHQINVEFLLQLQPEWQRFVTLVKHNQELRNVSYHKLYDMLKQHHNEVYEIRAERQARTANPLVLVAQQQPVYHPQSNVNHYNQNFSTRSQPAATRNRGKAIAYSSPPTYDQAPAMDADDDDMSKEKEIDKLMALISLSFKKIYKPTSNNLRTSSNTSRANQDNSLRVNRGTGYDNQRVVNVAGARETIGSQVVQKSGIQCYNCKEFGHVTRECQKPKRARDSAYHKDKMILWKQEEARIQLSAIHVDWKDDSDDEPENQELEAHYLYMAKIQEVFPDATTNSGPIFDAEPLQKVQYDDDHYNVFANDKTHPKQPESINDTYSKKQCDNRVIIDSLDMGNNGYTADQDDDDLANERDLLASLIDKLKHEIDDSKKQANNELQKTNQMMVKDLVKFQDKIQRHNDVKYMSNVELECAKAKTELMSYKTESQKSMSNYSYQICELNKKIFDLNEDLVAHQRTISNMSKEKETPKQIYKTREDKELEKVIVLEKKIKVLDDTVYKTGQSVQTMNMLNQNCKMSFVKPKFFKKAQRVNHRCNFESGKNSRPKTKFSYTIQSISLKLQKSDQNGMDHSWSNIVFHPVMLSYLTNMEEASLLMDTVLNSTMMRNN